MNPLSATMQPVSALVKVILVLLSEMVLLSQTEQLQLFSSYGQLGYNLFYESTSKMLHMIFSATPSNLHLLRKHTTCTLTWALEWPLAQSNKIRQGWRKVCFL